MLDSNSYAKIEDALRSADNALGMGNVRQAIQEMLWALESASTLFRDEEVQNEKIRGDYFNQIIQSLKKARTGTPKAYIGMDDEFTWLSFFAERGRNTPWR